MSRLLIQPATSLLLFCAAIAASAALITYEPDTSYFPNPETGPAYKIGSTGQTSLNPPIKNFATTMRSRRLNQWTTVVWNCYYIGNYKTSDLGDSLLQRLRDNFAACRELGYKLTAHFHYAYEYTYESPMVWTEGEKEATAEVIIKHLGQLKPVFFDNADVLAFNSLGMIGPWGEMWISGVGNIGTGPPPNHRTVNDNTRAIISAMLKNTPPDRFVIATWDIRRQIWGSQPMSEEEAFSGSDKSRIGYGNHCYLTDSDGSYKNNQMRGTTATMAIEGLYTPGVGSPDPDCGYRPTADEFVAEITAAHWDHLNAERIAECMQKDRTHPDVVRVYKALQYRYRIVEALLPDSVRPGGAFSARLLMRNDGGQALYNPRLIELVLRRRSDGLLLRLNIDGDGKGNRLYFPKPLSERQWIIDAGLLPATPEGVYDVVLNLPDPYPSIRNRPEYSIRLASRGVWEEKTGFNLLKHAVTVSAASQGNAYRGNRWFVGNGIEAPSPSDNKKPLVVFIRPGSDTTISGSLALGALRVRAHDPDAGTADGAGIKNVRFELRANNTVLDTHTESTVPYEWEFDATKRDNGNYTVRATAYSTADAGADSATAQIAITLDKPQTAVSAGIRRTHGAVLFPVPSRLYDLRGRRISAVEIGRNLYIEKEASSGQKPVLKLPR